MYALDPLLRSLCFSDGKEGMAIDKNRWGNRCSDLSYSLAGNGSFVTGIEVNRVAAIVDLGTANDLRGRYGFEDADNGGVGFASLRLDGGKIMILKDDNVEEIYQPLQEGRQNFYRRWTISERANQTRAHLPPAHRRSKRQEFSTHRQANRGRVPSRGSGHAAMGVALVQHWSNFARRGGCLNSRFRRRKQVNELPT